VRATPAKGCWALIPEQSLIGSKGGVMTTLKRLITSWQLSAGLHALRDGASESDIEDFEFLADWRLPTEWRDLYLFANGAALFKENLRVYPLRGDDWSLLDASQFYRDMDWPVPEELWIAGDNGHGDAFGLWLPSANRETASVVEMLYSRELVFAGSSLSAFLLAKSAHFLLAYDAPSAALDALDVPLELRKTQDFEIPTGL